MLETERFKYYFFVIQEVEFFLPPRKNDFSNDTLVNIISWASSRVSRGSESGKVLSLQKIYEGLKRTSHENLLDDPPRRPPELLYIDWKVLILQVPQEDISTSGNSGVKIILKGL